MMSLTRRLCRADVSGRHTKTFLQNQLLATSKTATFPAKIYEPKLSTLPCKEMETKLDGELERVYLSTSLLLSRARIYIWL